MSGVAGSLEQSGLLKNVLLLAVSVAGALLVAEAVSRYLMPISVGYTVLSLQGQPLGGPLAEGGAAGSGEGELRPDVSYRVVTQEFDTVVTHTKEGYRGLSRPQDPEVLFIGDSFTYGTGLNDKETIPYIYCRETHLICVNLGVPGTATVRQVARLERYLTEYGWRPREVKLLFMGMTAALMSGNDLSGNLEEIEEIETQDAGAAPARKVGLFAAIYDRRSLILEYSNLVRNAYYVYAPLLRAKLSPGMGNTELQQALAVTARQFRTLEELAARYGFEYSIYIIPPMQDVMNGGYEDALAAIKEIAQTDRVYSIAPALLEDGQPEQYYYAMDGHPNVAGAAKLARFMVALDEADARNAIVGPAGASPQERSRPRRDGAHPADLNRHAGR